MSICGGDVASSSSITVINSSYFGQRRRSVDSAAAADSSGDDSSACGSPRCNASSDRHALEALSLSRMLRDLQRTLALLSREQGAVSPEDLAYYQVGCLPLPILAI